jgi:hypothetical protein
MLVRRDMHIAEEFKEDAQHFPTERAFPDTFYPNIYLRKRAQKCG